MKARVGPYRRFLMDTSLKKNGSCCAKTHGTGWLGFAANLGPFPGAAAVQAKKPDGETGFLSARDRSALSLVPNVRDSVFWGSYHPPADLGDRPIRPRRKGPARLRPRKPSFGAAGLPRRF